MRFTKVIFTIAATAALAGCLDNDLERGVAGAAAGALIADATENDVVTGAAIGAAAGVFCDDLNVPGCRPRY